MEMNRRDFIKSATVLLPVPILTKDYDHERLRWFVQNPPFPFVAVHPSHASVIEDVSRYGVVLVPRVPEHLVWSCEHIDTNDRALRAVNKYTRRIASPGSILIDWRRERSW